MNVIPLNLVKEMLISIKKEVDSWLSKVEIGMGLRGPGLEEHRVKPITILERPAVGKNKESGLGKVDGAVGHFDQVKSGLDISSSFGSAEVNKKQALINCMATQSSVEDGEVAEQKMERMQWKVKEDEKVLGDGSGEQVPKDGRVVDVGMAMTGERDESDDGGRLVIPKLKEPDFAGKLAVGSDFHGSGLVMIAEH